MYVWLVDGESNLDLDLVRKGACPAGTMLAPNPSDLLIASAEYKRFEDKLSELEQMAKQDKLGIWK